MDLSNGKIHLLCPDGIGDFAWLYSKLKALVDQGRDVTFWFNSTESNRVRPYAEMLGITHYFTYIDIRELLEYPGEFTQDEYEEGGAFYVHPNVHLGEGKRLKDWHPQYEFQNPAPILPDTPKTDEIIVYMASAQYMEGNWFPAGWARTIERIEKNYGPVRIIGAAWDKPFAEKVLEFYKPSAVTLAQPLQDVLPIVKSAKAMLGIASGMTILSTYLRTPTWILYPRCLSDLRGTWEMDCPNVTSFVDEMVELLDKNLEKTFQLERK